MSWSKTYIVSNNPDTLHEELQAHSLYDYFVIEGDGITVYLTATPSAAEETSLDDIINGHSSGAPIKVKLFQHTPNNSDHRVINYKTGLTSALFPKRTFTQGELQQVEWYSDEALTDLVLRVEISYTRDSLGFAVDRTTTRTWINEDNSDNPKKKITKKVYDTASKIHEGKRRRGNLIDILTNNVMGMMIETMALDPTDPIEVAGILDEGRDFMKTYQTEISAFVQESHTAFRVEVQNDTIHAWLDYLPASLGGSTDIRTYIINELSI